MLGFYVTQIHISAVCNLSKFLSPIKQHIYSCKFQNADVEQFIYSKLPKIIVQIFVNLY